MKMQMSREVTSEEGEIQGHCSWQALHQPYSEYAYTRDFVALVCVNLN